MCGRYTLAKPIKTLKDHFKPVSVELAHKERFNIAPSQEAPVVVSVDGKRHLRSLKWGLIPHWAKDLKTANPQINARAETVHEKPTFKDSFKTRRCLIPADGFVEWAQKGDKKVPHYILLKTGVLFAFAGIWSEWNKNRTPLLTYSILTIEANSLLKAIHHRMPVILPADKYDLWVDPSTDHESLRSLLRPFSPDEMKTHIISKDINSPKNDFPECLAPVQ